jgi:hypothetical protein
VDENGEILLGREGKAKGKSMEDVAKELLELDSEQITIATKDDRVIRYEYFIFQLSTNMLMMLQS